MKTTTGSTSFVDQCVAAMNGTVPASVFVQNKKEKDKNTFYKGVFICISKEVFGVSLKFVSNNDTTGCASRGEHIISYTILEDGSVQLSIVPLPLGNVAFLARNLPKSRRGPDKCGVHANAVVENLRAIEWHHVHFDDPFEKVDETKLQLQGIVAGTPMETSGGLRETHSREFKLPRNPFNPGVVGFANEVIPTIINANSVNELFVGVADCGAQMGVVLAGDFAESVRTIQATLRTSLNGKLFPSLPPGSMKIELIPVADPLSSYEASELCCAEFELSGHLSDSFRTIYENSSCRLLLHPEMGRDSIVVIARRSTIRSNCCDWSDVSEELLDEEYPTRVVVKVTTTLPADYPTMFMLETDVDSFLPLRSRTGVLGSMPPFACWLRVHDAARPVLLLRDALCSELYCRLLFCPLEVENNALCAFRRLGGVSVIPESEVRMNSVRLVFVTIDDRSIRRLLNWIAVDMYTGRYLCVILVPFDDLGRADLKDVVLKHTNSLQTETHCTVVDVRLCYDSSMLQLVPENIHAAAAFDSVVDNSVFSQIQLAQGLLSEDVRLQAINWLLGRSRCTPPWELVRDGFVVRTSQSLRISQEIENFFSRSDKIRKISVGKPFERCGATSVLRSVAYECHLSGYQVLWVEARTYPDQITIPAGTAPLLIVADDHVSESLVSDILEASAGGGRPTCLLVAERTTLESAVNRFAIRLSPFLDNVGIANFVSQLSSAIAHDDAAVGALRRAADYGSQCSPCDSNRHIYYFGLTAGKGEFSPAREWISGLCDVLALSAPCKEVAMSIAFVAVFCPQESQNVPIAILEGVIVDSVSIAFYDLFMNCGQFVRCCHPFFARLMLERWCKLNWRDITLNPIHLMETWESVSLILKNRLTPVAAQPVFQRILCRRVQGDLFSRFVCELICAEGVVDADGYITIGEVSTSKRAKLLLDALELGKQFIGKGHYETLVSRIYRALAKFYKTEIKKRRKFLSKSCSYAANAMAILNNDISKQNCAVMYANAWKHGADNTEYDYRRESKKLFRELMLVPIMCKDALRMFKQFFGEDSQANSEKEEETLAEDDVELRVQEFGPADEAWMRWWGEQYKDLIWWAEERSIVQD